MCNLLIENETVSSSKRRPSRSSLRASGLKMFFPLLQQILKLLKMTAEYGVQAVPLLIHHHSSLDFVLSELLSPLTRLPSHFVKQRRSITNRCALLFIRIQSADGDPHSNAILLYHMGRRRGGAHCIQQTLTHLI